MKLKLRVDLGNGPIEVETNLWVMTQWERKYKRKLSDMGSGIGIEDLAFMAHCALQQNSVVVPVALDDFIKALHNVEVVTDEEAIDRPIEAAPTDTL
jgi:hypothetical protein